jgi:hypothetical protein
MQNIRKRYHWLEMGEDAHRQYIDAQAVFTTWEAARKAAAEVRGGMYWKRQGTTEYLIRTSTNNSQKSLGPRSAETESIFEKFTTRKMQAEQRLADISLELERHQRMNRALHVGRAPKLLVDILDRLNRSGLAEYFTVVGTHALYAYEAAAGVRFGEADALATRDVDLLWDVRKRLSFMTQMESLGTSMLNLIQKVDATFRLRDSQKYTAVNSKGFEVDIIRREVKDNDPHPLQITDDQEDFWVVPAKKAELLLAGPRFSRMVVATSGQMARMETIHPGTFVKFKRWMSEQPERDPLKRRRDMLQADLVNELVERYMPNLELN